MGQRVVLGAVALLVTACSTEFHSLGADASPDGTTIQEDAAPTLPDASPLPLSIESITPILGSVAGGEEVTIHGQGFTSSTRVSLGDFECSSPVAHSSQLMTCTTAATNFAEVTVDAVVTDAAQSSTLEAAFTYQCPWTTSSGRRSCGAIPAPHVPDQAVTTWLTKFEPGHGFSANADGTGSSNLADASDYVLGAQSAFVETDGAGTLRTLQKLAIAPIDFGGQDLKVWVKVDNVTHLTALDVWLGDATLANSYRFRLRSSQGQQWMTNGDWVSFAIPWAASNYTQVGTPNRHAIEGISIRVVDDATGARVRVHINGLATVTEPVIKFPKGVVSFTFDDGYATMVNPGATTLAQYGFAGTSYVIVDAIDTPGYATLANLKTLATQGWDISVHANTDAHHHARYPSLTTAVVEDDMVDARAWLISHGFKGYNHCAYPGGEFSGGTADVLSVAGVYFTSCRSIYQRQQETFLPADARKLRVLYVTNTTSLAAVEKAIDETLTSHDWTILVFHRLVPNAPTTSTEWSASDFAALAAYVAASNVPVRTVDSVLAQ